MRPLLVLLVIALCACAPREKEANAQGQTKAQVEALCKQHMTTYYTAVRDSAARYASGPDDARSIGIAAVSENAALLIPYVNTLTESITWHMDPYKDQQRIQSWRERLTAENTQNARDFAVSIVVEARAGK